MHISFEKYHGAGNDFIMIDNRTGIFKENSNDLIRAWCDRHFGIGADGLILIEKSEGRLFRMVYFNADGNEGSMCGNGGRCAVAFALKLRMFQPNNQVLFEASDGLHSASVLWFDNMGSATVKLGMANVNEIECGADYFFLNTGSPHYVTYVNSLSDINVVDVGRKIRYGERFNANGTNVNFVSQNNNRLAVRTYERGVENETLACGSGVTAVAIAEAIKENKSGRISTEVQTLGGLLKVSFLFKNNSATEVFLEGPAQFVFTGIIDLQP